MNNLLLIFLMLAVFAFGYYIVAKMDRFIKANKRKPVVWKKKRRD